MTTPLRTLEYLRLKFSFLPEETFNELSHRLTRHHLPAGSLLLERGQVCTRAYIMEKGLAHAWYVVNDEPVTAWFAKEFTVFFSRRSFFCQEPSDECIELLEDSEFLSIAYADLEDLYAQYPAMNQFGRLLSHHYMLEQEKRIKMLRRLKGDERLKRFLAEEPELYRRAPQQAIATYLGLARETLSRLRRHR